MEIATQEALWWESLFESGFRPDELQVFADWLEDGGDNCGSAILRWAARHGRKPCTGYPTYSTGMNGESWDWWSHRQTRRSAGERAATVPDTVFACLTGSDDSPSRNYREFASTKEAWAALVEAARKADWKEG